MRLIGAHPRARRHDPARRARHADGDGRLRPHRRLNYGRIIAEGHAGGDPQNPAVIHAYLGQGRRQAMRRLEIRDLVCGYGQRRRTKASRSALRRASSWPSSAPTAPARSTTLRAISGLLQPAPGQHHLRGPDITFASPRAVLAARHRPLPGRPPGLSAHECRGESGDGRLSAPRLARHRRRPCAHFRASSRASPSGATRSQAPFRGASSRCWRSAGR